MSKTYHTGNPHADQIIKILSKNLSSGYKPDDVFMDWLDAVQATLEAIPAHAESVAKSGHMATDTPETQKLFERLRSRYRNKDAFNHFAHAFAVLMDSVTPEAPEDILGECYMAWGYPNKWAGQFFTPMSIARMMAMMTVGEAEAEVHTRLKEAIAQSPLAEAATLTGLIVAEGEAFDWFITRVLPAALPFYKPVTVCDPCVGSGVMLLAASACFPRWMIELGLVQFYGQDIDAGCVKMCQINVMLYGLNGWGACWHTAGLPLAAQVAKLPPQVVYPPPTEPTITVAPPSAKPAKRGEQLSFF